MFLSFESQDERRNYGGSCFIELQFCKLPSTTPLRKIVSVRNIEYWKDDSLYVSGNEDAFDDFYMAYSQIFTDGAYNHLQSGVVDICGINYYNPVLTEAIIQRLLLEKPTDYERLVDWLKKAKSYNGFYILGV